MKYISVIFAPILLLASFASNSAETIGSFTVDSFLSDKIKTVSARSKGPKVTINYECMIGENLVRDQKLEILINELDTQLFNGVAVVEYHIENISDRFTDNDVSLYVTRPPGWSVDYISNSIGATDLVFIEDLGKGKEVILSITLLKSFKNQEMVFNTTDRVKVTGFVDAVSKVNAQCKTF